MSDVTFGVKVSEEMKNELSELMKINQLSGKEFMQLLLTTYKIEQAKQEDDLFASDMSELQILLQRIQNIYLNISEKSKLMVNHQIKAVEEEKKRQEEETKQLKEELTNLQKKIMLLEEENRALSELIKNLEEENNHILNEKEEHKNQIKNYVLLHTKFQQEIKLLEEKIENLKRIELENEERSSENTTLKNRNDELASEVWFLKRQIDKLEAEKSQMRLTSELELKNNLLEQKLAFNEQIEKLKEENLCIQREFNNKLQTFYVEKQEKLAEIE